MSTKIRLDVLLVDRGLAKDLKEAQALVLAGQVLSGDTLLDEAGTSVAKDLPLRLRGVKNFASRAGDKLDAGLDAAGFDVRGLRCLDLGASTGGFTDCLLRRGAVKVLAVDKGRRQLDFVLSQDPRVESREGLDALDLTPDQTGPLDFACADISFSPLAPFLPLLAKLLPAGSPWIVLVKPQFEVDLCQLPEGGVLLDQGLRRSALQGVRAAAQASGLGPLGWVESPLPGAKGNVEFLLWGRRI